MDERLLKLYEEEGVDAVIDQIRARNNPATEQPAPSLPEWEATLDGPAPSLQEPVPPLEEEIPPDPKPDYSKMNIIEIADAVGAISVDPKKYMYQPAPTPEEDVGILEQVGRGARVGFDGVRIGYYGSRALMEEGPEQRDAYLAKAREIKAKQEQEGYAPRMMEFSEAKSARDYLDWAAGTAGTLGPIVGSIMAGGLTAGKAGGVAGASFGPKGAAIGAVGGSVIGSFSVGWGLYAGGLYSDLTEMGVDDDKAREAALSYGAMSSLVSIVPPAAASSAILGALGKNYVRSRVKNAVIGAGIGGPAEGLAEAVAESFVIMGEEFATGERKPMEEVRTRVLNAGAAGALMGVGIGTVGGAAQPKVSVDQVIDGFLDQVKGVERREANSLLKQDLIQTLEARTDLTPEQSQVLKYLKQQQEDPATKNMQIDRGVRDIQQLAINSKKRTPEQNRARLEELINKPNRTTLEDAEIAVIQINDPAIYQERIQRQRQETARLEMLKAVAPMTFQALQTKEQQNQALGEGWSEPVEVGGFTFRENASGTLAVFNAPETIQGTRVKTPLGEAVMVFDDSVVTPEGASLLQIARQSIPAKVGDPATVTQQQPELPGLTPPPAEGAGVAPLDPGTPPAAGTTVTPPQGTPPAGPTLVQAEMNLAPQTMAAVAQVVAEKAAAPKQPITATGDTVQGELVAGEGTALAGTDVSQPSVITPQPRTPTKTGKVTLDDGLIQSAATKNKVPAVQNFFAKEGEPGVEEVINTGEWTGNTFTTARQMALGLDVIVPPDATLPVGMKAEPRTTALGTTEQVVTEVTYEGNTYGRGDTATDFLINGQRSSLEGFKDIYRKSPQRLQRSENARKGAAGRKKEGLSAEETAQRIAGLDAVDRMLYEDFSERALRFIEKSNISTEEKDAARDFAQDRITKSFAERAPAEALPAESAGLAKRFNEALIGVFETNAAKPKPPTANLSRDIGAATKALTNQLVKEGSTKAEAQAAVAPIAARYQTYGDSPIGIAMGAVKEARRRTSRARDNQAAAAPDLAAGIQGERRAEPLEPSKIDARTRADVEGRKARLTPEDREILKAWTEGDTLSETEAARFADLQDYLLGENTYEQIYPQADTGTGSTLERGSDARPSPVTVSRPVESTATGDPAADGEARPDGVVGSDAGTAGTVQAAPDVQDGGRGVSNPPGRPGSRPPGLAANARRFFVQSFARLKQEFIDSLPEAEIQRIYEGIQAIFNPEAAVQGRRVVSYSAAPMGDLTALPAEQLLQQAIRGVEEIRGTPNRTKVIREMAGQLILNRGFADTKTFIETMANNETLPEDVRMRAKEFLKLGQRGFDWNNVAVQVGIFRNKDGTRTTWAGVLGQDKRGGLSIAINLDNRHDRDSAIQTAGHELQHVITNVKVDAFLGLPGGDGITLNATERTAFENLQKLWEKAITAAAEQYGLDLPEKPTAADYARVGEELYERTDPGLGSQAERRLAGLRNLKEFVVELPSSPEFRELLTELGLAENAGQAELANIIAGRNIAATSPLGKAFQDAWAVNFPEGEVTSEPTALSREMDRLRRTSEYVEAELEARGLEGTTEDRQILVNEFLAQEAGVEEAGADIDAVADPVTMSRATAVDEDAPTLEASNATPSPIETIFDSREGIGQVPNQVDIDYFGFVKYMTPSEFRRLVPGGVSGAETKDFVVGALGRGEKLGPPFLSATWDDAAGVWKINDHEGRSRSDAVSEVFGNVAIPVHVFPSGLRARDLTPAMREAAFIPQSQVRSWESANLRDLVEPVTIGTNQATESRAAAMEFVSPNDAEGDLTFDQAQAALTGPQQEQLRAFAAKVHEVFGLGETTVTDAIGDWADGAEPTTVTEHFAPGLTYEDVKVMAALKGAIRNQKAVIPFLKGEGGESYVYDFFIPDQTAAQARGILEEAGIQFRTLIEQNGGTRVLVFDGDGSVRQAFDALITKNNYEFSYNQGRGEFLGSWDSRAEGKDIYERTVAEALGRIRGAQYDTGGAGSLRASRISELAAEAGLTLPTESRATPEPTNENRDTYFGTPTAILRGPAKGGQGATGPSRQSQRIARSVADRAGEVRDAALGVLAEKGLVRGNLARWSEAQARKVSDTVALYLIADDRKLAAAKTPAEKTLAATIRRFREIVPIVPKEQIDQLITSEADPLSVLDSAVEMFESGTISEDRYGAALAELGRRYGVTISADLDVAAVTLRDFFEDNPSAGARWVLEGEGAESKAYKDDNAVIYKLSPIRKDLLGVEPISRKDLTLTDKQPPFFNRDGGMPFFDRLIGANNMPGHTPTEIAGIVDDGRVIIKQPDLERAEPTTAELVDRATKSGIRVLRSQKEDPRFGGDINTTPIVFRIDGEPWLALDFNPRNARKIEGLPVAFDLVFHKLTESDIAANADIGQAVESLSDAAAESRAVSPQQDADYLAAVERGDMETAQRMVDEAAEAARYTVFAWHGTPAGRFNVFDFSDRGNWLGDGAYFSNDEFTASQYKRDKEGFLGSGAFPFHLRLVNPYKWDGLTLGEVYRRGEPFSALPQDIQKILGSTAETPSIEEAATKVTQALKNRGHDGVRGPDTTQRKSPEAIVSLGSNQSLEQYLRDRNPTGEITVTPRQDGAYVYRIKNDAGTVELTTSGYIVGGQFELPLRVLSDTSELAPVEVVELVVFTPEQIKSAEVVTRDNNGNVIPLSQRFNEESADIRESRALADPDEETLSASVVLNEGRPVNEFGLPETETTSGVTADGELDVADAKLDPAFKSFLKVVGAFESVPDKLRRGMGLDKLAAAIENYFDRYEQRMGLANGLLRRARQKMGLRGEKEAMSTFERYMRERENGRRNAAEQIYNNATESQRSLIDAWVAYAKETGVINTQLRTPDGKPMQVYDSKLKKWRPIRSVKEFFPRVLRPEVQRVLANPALDPALYNDLLDALVADGRVKTREDANRYIKKDYFSTDTTQDFFAGVERGRNDPLPEIFYDYSFNAATRYMKKWAQRTSQIENFGQATTQGTGDWFDTNIPKVRDDATRRYLTQIKDRVYEAKENDAFGTLMNWFNVSATGLQLGNPATAFLNLFGGSGLNVMEYGWKNTIKAAKEVLSDWNNVMQSGADLGIVGKDMLNILNDADMDGSKYFSENSTVSQALSKFASFTMKWGGYTGTENFIRASGMLAARAKLMDSIAANNKNPSSSKARWVYDFAKRENLNADALIQENGQGPETAKFLRRAVNIPQGSYRIDMTPIYVDVPLGRFLFKYQKFGTQLTRMFWRHHLKPFIDNPNPANFGKLLHFFGAAMGAGTIIAMGRATLFGYPDPGPDEEDLKKALADQDTARAWSFIFSRAWHSMNAAGALGFFGNYAQFALDWRDQQRVKNPLKPPGLASIDAVMELLNRLREQGTLTGRDLDEIAESTLALYRANKRIGLSTMDAVGGDWNRVREWAAEKQIRQTRKYTRWYAQENQIEAKRSMPEGRVAKTPMSPINREITQALRRGDYAAAKIIMDEALKKAATKEERDAMRNSIQASVRIRQPITIAGSAPSIEQRRDFLKWAKKNVPGFRYEQIRRDDENYRKGAARLGINIR